MAKSNNNNKEQKSYEQHRTEFFELRKSQSGQVKTKLIDMIISLKAEGKQQQETYKTLLTDLKGAVDKSYISKLTKEQYMTKEELIAEAERLTEQEKLKESIKTPQVVVGADGQTEVVYEEDDEEISKLSPGAQRDILKSKNDSQSKKISAGSAQIARTKPSVQAGELDGEDEEEEETQEEEGGYNNTVQEVSNKITVDSPKLIDEIKKIVNTGRGIVIFVDNNNVAETIVAGDLLH